MECRRLTEDGAPLAREAIGRVKIGKNGPWPSLEYVRAFLVEADNVLIVATEDGEPIGFALAYLLDRIDGNRRMALFYEIEVAANHRRRGVARAMIELLKSVCAPENVVKMWVQTSHANEAAVALYRSTGAHETASGGETVFVYNFRG